jgi:hypothetical protein
MQKNNKSLEYIFKILTKDDDNKNISIDTYLLMIGILFATILVFSPQLYIKNNIYYVSRKINSLYIQYQILKDENKVLKRQYEIAIFKYNQKEELK